MNGHLLRPVMSGGKFGYLDNNGALAIPPTFEYLGQFSDGLAAFGVGARYGFIDEAGQMVLPARFLSGIADAPQFADGLCAVKEDGLVGYINRRGEYEIAPRFAYGGAFCNGFAVTLAADSHSGYQLIDTQGQTIVTYKEFEIDLNPGRLDFIKCTIKQRNLLLDGFVDFQDQIVIPARHEYLGEPAEGLVQFSDDPSGPFGFMDYGGEEVIRALYRNRGSFFVNGMAPAQTSRRVAGFIARDGNFAISPQFQNAWPFHDGLACVQVKGKQGYVDLRGDLCVEPRFTEAEPFRDGFATVKYEGKWAVIDRKGRFIFLEQ